jgi:predicted enzyme involved in methoxymalonyl-ACP biosynthesis
VQIIVTENNETWQGRILGLGDNGVVYTLNNKNEWEGNIWKFAD